VTSVHALRHHRSHEHLQVGSAGPARAPADRRDSPFHGAAAERVRGFAEGSTHWATLRALITDGKVTGPLVHDARIAALCLASGVTELWILNRDFSRFPALKTRNPLP